MCRERGTERLYSLADVNWNVVATTNATGAVQERMKYDAFGKVMWMNAGFATKAASDLAWNRTFTGQVLDAESDLMLYRNRYYHTGLGRFISRDPIGYRAKDINLYRYTKNIPQYSTDSHGLRTSSCKCCADAKSDAGKSNEGVPYGTVICCDDRPLICLFGTPSPGNNPYANAVKLACLIVHESTHVPQVDCSNGVEGYSTPGFNSEEGAIPPLPPS